MTIEIFFTSAKIRFYFFLFQSCFNPNLLQVASQETYGTMACIVRSLTPEHELGFLTNRHVAVHLDNPHQKMFHPLPPNLGPGVYLGSVERATSFITDDLWYGGIFAGLNEGIRLHRHFRLCNFKFRLYCILTSQAGICFLECLQINGVKKLSFLSQLLTIRSEMIRCTKQKLSYERMGLSFLSRRAST